MPVCLVMWELMRWASLQVADRPDPALNGLARLLRGLRLRMTALLQGAWLQLLARLQLQHGPPIAHAVHVHHAAGKGWI